MVESAGKRSLPKYQKAAQAATVTTPKITSIKNRLNIQPKNLARSWFIQFVYIVSELSQTEYVRRLQNSKKIGRRKAYVLSNKQNWCAYFTLLFVNFCKQQQRNKQEIITHAYTAIALVAVAVEVCLI